MKTETLDRGRIRVVVDCLPLLQLNGLDTFEKVMARDSGRIVRDFPGRQTVRLEMNASSGRTQGVYLKRYERRYLTRFQRLKRWVRWPGSGDEAVQEWENLQQLRALGIGTASPIAIGQEKDHGMVARSFVMTAEISAAEEGHRFLENAVGSERRYFVQRVGEMARSFHDAGFVHKDFYLGHILAARASRGIELFLIDLQRAVKPCCFRRRWLVKDLGALAYSTLRAGASRAELLLCFKAYCGHEELAADEKRLARRALRRVAWLGTRRPKHDGDFDPGLDRASEE
jgi:hypothetical protein